MHCALNNTWKQILYGQRKTWCCVCTSVDCYCDCTVHLTLSSGRDRFISVKLTSVSWGGGASSKYEVDFLVFRIYMFIVTWNYRCANTCIHIQHVNHTNAAQCRSQSMLLYCTAMKCISRVCHDNHWLWLWLDRYRSLRLRMSHECNHGNFWNSCQLKLLGGQGETSLKLKQQAKL